MREIKFRQWLSSKKVMVEGPCIVRDGHWRGPLSVTFSSDPLMQFTGLKDRNGKEIYEGDIVENDRGEIGEVVFASGAFVSKYIGEYAWDALEPCDGLMHRQIVLGNIHENPKLLEGI